jgi:hypothetical protein
LIRNASVRRTFNFVAPCDRCSSNAVAVMSEAIEKMEAAHEAKINVLLSAISDLTSLVKQNGIDTKATQVWILFLNINVKEWLPLNIELTINMKDIFLMHSLYI